MNRLLRRFHPEPAAAAPAPGLRLVGCETDAVRVERIRAEIHAGTYETQARIDAAVDRLVDRFGG